MEQKMFCYQCRKPPGARAAPCPAYAERNLDVAAMQDLLVYVTKGISGLLRLHCVRKVSRHCQNQIT